MHDASLFEQVGLPTLVVATDPFRVTVDATADVIGFTGLRVIFVEHPVSRLTPEGFEALARKSAAEIAAQLTDDV